MSAEKDITSIWTYDKRGHICKHLNKFEKGERDGGVYSSRVGGEEAAYFQTFNSNEVEIEFEHLDGTKTKKWLRLTIGTTTGDSIIGLDDGHFYLQEYGDGIKEVSQIDPVWVAKSIANLRSIDDKVGNTFDLDTEYKSNIVGAINEIYQLARSPRIIRGSIDYVYTGQEIENPKDLDIRLNTKTNKFEYYSDLGEWIVLPTNWQSLTKLVRSKDDLTNSPYNGMTIGILDENISLRYNEEEWEEVQVKDYENGDEFLVNNIYDNKNQRWSLEGSVVNTTSGWKCIVNRR